MQKQAQVELAIRRLSRLSALQREYGSQLNQAGVRLVRSSMFSAYCDCRALGLGDRARDILTNPLPPEPMTPRPLALPQPAQVGV